MFQKLKMKVFFNEFMIRLKPAMKEDYEFIYQLVVEMFKTNLNVSYLKLETFDEFVTRSFTNDDIHYIIVKENNEKIGHIHILKNNEIGYAVLSKYQNKGFGTDAIKKIMELHPRERYFLTIHNQNIASKRLAEKNGFHPKGTIYEKIL